MARAAAHRTTKLLVDGTETRGYAVVDGEINTRIRNACMDKVGNSGDGVIGYLVTSGLYNDVAAG